MPDKVEQVDRDAAMQMLNFAFRNTDVEISGECFDNMALTLANHRQAAIDTVFTFLREHAGDAKAYGAAHIETDLAAGCSHEEAALSSFLAMLDTLEGTLGKVL